VRADFRYSGGLLRPGYKVFFDASGSGPHIKSYEWLFGDGTSASGQRVTHKFPDAQGTMWDGSASAAGRFRVMLMVVDKNGGQDALYQPVVIATALHPANANADTDSRPAPGLDYSYYETANPTLAAISAMLPTATGITTAIDASIRKRDTNYGIVEDGYITVPADGGYTFTLTARDEARFEIDGLTVAASPKPFDQVCGMPGNAVQSVTGSIALAEGRHAIRISMTYTTGAPTPKDNGFALYWQGPGIPLSAIPSSTLTH
jgi:PKD repeat protein